MTRALDVLLTVSDLGEADLSSVARAAGLHPTTTLRLLESLRSRGFVRHRRGAYEIGPRAFEVGSTFLNRVSLAHEAQPLVEELAGRLNETANLGILVDGEVLPGDRPGPPRARDPGDAGGRHPAHCTALGKALLAHMPWESVESILAAYPPVRLTPTTLVEPEALRTELQRVARQGTRSTRRSGRPGSCVSQRRSGA